MVESPRARLSPTEWRILRIIWDRRRATVQDILMDLADQSPAQGYRQLHVDLKRMAAKGYVEVDGEKRPHYYSSPVDRGTVIREAARQFMSTTLGNEPENLRILLQTVREELGEG